MGGQDRDGRDPSIDERVPGGCDGGSAGGEPAGTAGSPSPGRDALGAGDRPAERGGAGEHATVHAERAHPALPEPVEVTVRAEAEVGAGEVVEPAVAPRRRHRIHHVLIVRLVFVALAGLGLYVVWPGLLDVFASWPRLRSIHWGWFPAMAGLVFCSYLCVWALYRIVLHLRGWLLIATSQLSSAAFMRFVPGGAATASAMLFQMLVEAGVRGARVGTGITAVNIMSGGTVLALPLFTLPLLLGLQAADSTLRRIGYVGLGALGVLIAFSLLLLLADRPLRLIGGAYARLWSRFFRTRRPLEMDLPDVLLRERDLVRDVLGERWRAATAAALGQRGFDFAALLAALYAVGADVNPLIVLLAYAVAQILILLPITPGGLGIVEVGLVGLLGLAGVPSGAALLATLTYRLFTYWGPLAAGPVAYGVFVHRFGGRLRDARPAADGGG